MQTEAVKPLKAHPRVELGNKRTPRDIAQQKREAASRPITTYDGEHLSDQTPQSVGAEESLAHIRPGLQQQQFKKLKNGQIPWEAVIDLHGYRIEEARAALSVFLRRCQHRGITCVRVIHGKGLHRSDAEITIKSAMASWLQQLNCVMGFASCTPADGGTGAVYVLLKRSKIRADNTD
jgi:DNA-nicking Smr family endonuclease